MSSLPVRTHSSVPLPRYQNTDEPFPTPRFCWEATDSTWPVLASYRARRAGDPPPPGRAGTALAGTRACRRRSPPYRCSMLKLRRTCGIADSASSARQSSLVTKTTFSGKVSKRNCRLGGMSPLRATAQALPGDRGPAIARRRGRLWRPDRMLDRSSCKRQIDMSRNWSRSPGRKVPHGERLADGPEPELAGLPQPAGTCAPGCPCAAAACVRARGCGLAAGRACELTLSSAGAVPVERGRRAAHGLDTARDRLWRQGERGRQ